MSEKVGYVRVSKVDQHPELQVKALEAVGCTRIFTDKITGITRDRPGLSEALGYIREGDTLVVWKFDRIGRSTAHLCQLADDLEQRGIHLLSLTDGVDTSTSVGKMIFRMIAVIAEFERDLNHERTAAGLLAAKEQGRVGGRPHAISPEKRTLLLALYAQKERDPSITNAAICKQFHISESTLTRTIRVARAQTAAETT
jgi:DNA invertase Pin-like site-specific DNA recombinase